MKKSISAILLTAALLLSAGCSQHNNSNIGADNSSVQNSIQSENEITTSENAPVTSKPDSTPETESTPASSTDGQDISEKYPVYKDTFESIELSDDEKKLVTDFYDEYTKMALLFFNQNYEVRNALDIFRGTPYECVRTLSSDENITDEMFIRNFDDIDMSLIKYTGEAVNTMQKFKETRSLYFTDAYIDRWDGTDGGIIAYRMEEDGCVYQTAGSGGMTLPLGEYPDIYVKEIKNEADAVTIKVLADYRGLLDDNIEFGHGCEYQYITLIKGEDGRYRLDKMTCDSGNFNQPGELKPKDLYEKGTLHL